MNLNEKYEKLVDRYCEIILSDDIVDNDEVISLHTLYYALKAYFDDVHNIYDRVMKRINRNINESNCTFELLNGFSSQVNSSNSFKQIGLNYNDDNNRLSMIISSFKYSPIILCKDMGIDNYYYISNNKLDDELFSLCSLDIDNSFKTVEDAISLFKKFGVFDELKKGKVVQKFTHGDIDSVVTYDDIGRIDIKFKFNSLIDPDNVQSKPPIGIGIRRTVDYLLYNNHEAISRKIPVALSEIDSLSKELVDRYKNVKEKTM